MFSNKIITVNKWEVFSNGENTELQFTEQYRCAYAYLDYRDGVPFFRFDLIVVPKYVRDKALVWAKNNMKSIYKPQYNND